MKGRLGDRGPALDRPEASPVCPPLQGGQTGGPADSQAGLAREDAPCGPVRAGLGTIFWNFLMVGLTAYGGPAMMPALRERVVGKRGWLGREEFRLGLGLCQSLCFQVRCNLIK